MVKDKVIQWMILACQWLIPWIGERFKDINDWHTVSFTNMHVSLTKPVHWSVMCFVSLTDLWYHSPIHMLESLYRLPVCLYHSPIHGVVTDTLLSLISVNDPEESSPFKNHQWSKPPETWLGDCKPHGDALPERENSCDCQPKQKGREKLKELEDQKRNLSAVNHHQVIGMGHPMYYHIINVAFLLSVVSGQ